MKAKLTYKLEADNKVTTGVKELAVVKLEPGEQYPRVKKLG